MPKTTTPFDSKRHHIYVDAEVVHPETGAQHSAICILDSGAARTEFTDTFLYQAGFIPALNNDVKIKEHLQSQKYGKLVLERFDICGQRLSDFEVMISRFDSSWGIDALIGLDFFRRFRTTIDFENATIVAEPYSTT